MTLDMETQTMRFWVIKMLEDLAIGLAGGLDPWPHREGAGQCQKGEPGPSEPQAAQTRPLIQTASSDGSPPRFQGKNKSVCVIFWYLERSMNLI